MSTAEVLRTPSTKNIVETELSRLKKLNGLNNCSDNPIKQNGPRCFLVSVSLVLAKSLKLRRLMNNDDLLFLERLVEVSNSQSTLCPRAPRALQKRYDIIAEFPDKRTITGDEGTGGSGKYVLQSFLSEIDKKDNIISNYFDWTKVLKWGKVPNYLRSNRIFFNKKVHDKGCVILTIEINQSASASKDARITKTFAQTLQKMCSYNDSIVGGLLTVAREMSNEEKQQDRPNNSWTKKQLQNYIRQINISEKKNLAVGGTKPDIISRLKKTSHYDNYVVAYHDSRLHHSIGFTVCQKNDFSAKKQTKVGHPKLILCNWGKCYSGERKIQEDFINELNRRDLPNYQVHKIVLLLA